MKLQVGDWVNNKQYGYGIVVDEFFLNVHGIFFININKRLMFNHEGELKIINKMNHKKFDEEIKNEHT